MSLFNVDSGLCRKDGICAAACPSGVIAGDVKKLPRQVPGSEVNCIKCGHCMVYCPASAVELAGLEKPVAFDRADLPDAGAVSLLCKSRRSVRSYRNELVSKEVIADLLDTARYAPTAKNSQKVRWIVVYEREKIVELGDMLAQWMKDVARENPEDSVRAQGAGLAARWEKGRDVYFRGCPHLVLAVAPADYYWASVDATIALTYFELAAAAKGLGLCWAGYFVAGAARHEPLRKALGLGADEVLPGGFMLGYPRLRPKMIPARNPLNVAYI